MKEFKKVTKPIEADFYSIVEEDGTKYISLCGYTYLGDDWKGIKVSESYMPLSDFIKHYSEDNDYVVEMFGELKQYTKDIKNDDDVIDYINTYFDGNGADYILTYEQITEDAQCGNYAVIYSDLRAVLFYESDGCTFVVPCHADEIEKVIKANDHPHIIKHEVIYCDDSFIC